MNCLDYLLTYFIINGDNINFISVLCAVLFCIYSTMLIIGSIADPDENLRNRCLKISKYTIFMFTLFLLLALITPSTKRGCAIIIIPKIINNEKIDKNDLIYQNCLEWFNEITKSENK